jgi:hypothetical protein
MLRLASIFSIIKRSKSQAVLITPIAAEAPRLVYDEVDPRLSMSPFTAVLPEAPSPERQVISSPNGSTSTRSLMQGMNTNAPRQAVSNISNTAPDISSQSSIIPSSYTDVNPFDSTAPNFSSQSTSSAISRTTAPGKSGKVIEKLANDLDIAHRERDLYKLRNEELERRLELMQTKMEDLTERKNRAEQESAINEAAISRRDRKINELQADLDIQITRRTKAEAESKIAVTERDEAQSTRDREVYQAKEEVAYSNISYKMLVEERAKEKEMFQAKIDGIEADMKVMTNRIIETQESMRKINGISEGKDSHIERIRGVVRDVMEKYEKYKNDRDDDCKMFATLIRERLEQIDGGLEQLNETKTRMRWVINVQENVGLGQPRRGLGESKTRGDGSELNKAQWKKSDEEAG